MEKWQEATTKFLDSYKDNEEFIGAILTGSYAVGNNNQNSDIDLFLVTKTGTQLRERGNKLVDGFLIEYFINPFAKINKYFEDELNTCHNSTTRMFANGKILIDKTGDVLLLVNKAKEFLKKDFNPIDDGVYKMNCYSVWDGFDELKGKYERKEDIDFSYYIFLERLINSYFQNSRISSLPLNKIEYILKDENYRNRYNINELPEKEFFDLLLKCFTEKDYDRKYQNAENLYKYFLSKFDDFDINNFSFVSKVEL